MADETAPKLKPIIVTEKKIISLRKKSEAAEQSAKPTKSLAIDRKIPTATVLPESKRLAAEQSATTAIVKPVLKKSLKSDIDDIDEDELLADSPSPPSISQVALTKQDSKKVEAHALKSIRSIKATTASKTVFANRRVIVRDSTEVASSSEDVDKTTSTDKAPASKGIFDRLEKKVIGVNEAAKRKIQRIVIKNTE